MINKAMTMLFFLRAWGLHSQQSAIDLAADDLILLFGANAYEEARRRRAQAEDLPAARHWSAVKSEIGRRILEVCGDPSSLEKLKSRLIETDESGCAIWDPPAGNRAEARRSAANRIEQTSSPIKPAGGSGRLVLSNDRRAAQEAIGCGVC